MKFNSHKFYGKITNDGKLKIDRNELDNFIKDYKDQACIIEIEILDSRKYNKLRAYYFNYILPTVRNLFWDNGIRMDIEGTNYFLKKTYPLFMEEKINPETQKWEVTIKSINDLNKYEFYDYIEHIKQYIAENFDYFLTDPQIKN